MYSVKRSKTVSCLQKPSFRAQKFILKSHLLLKMNLEIKFRVFLYLRKAIPKNSIVISHDYQISDFIRFNNLNFLFSHQSNLQKVAMFFSRRYKQLFILIRLPNLDEWKFRTDNNLYSGFLFVDTCLNFILCHLLSLRLSPCIHISKVIRVL